MANSKSTELEVDEMYRALPLRILRGVPTAKNETCLLGTLVPLLCNLLLTEHNGRPAEVGQEWEVE